MDIVIRAVALFAFMFLLTRIMGRRELSSLEPFDLILLIVLGDSIQRASRRTTTPSPVQSSPWGRSQRCRSSPRTASFKFPWARRVLDGDPIVLIQDGEVIERNLKRERITLGELAEQARVQQIGSLGDVQWAVFEPSGTISFIPKKQ